MSGTPVAPNSTAPPRPYGKALILLLVVLVAAGGWPGFKSAKYHLAIQRARREIARKDFNHAEFWGEQALSVNPNSPDAARVMAEINEAQDMPESLSWRIRVVQLAPESIPDHMAWAKCAVRFEHDQMARRALESLPDTFKPKSAEYNELMAGLASKGGMSAAAGFFFSKAAEIDPGNPIYKVNLAAFQLAYSHQPDSQAEAEQQLEALAKDPLVDVYAVRSLLDHALFTNNKAKAKSLSALLLSLPRHEFSDSIRSLRAMLDEPDFDSLIQKTEREAEKDPVSITEMGDWLNAHGRAKETNRWFDQLPEHERGNIGVQMTEAQALLDLQNWKALETILQGCHWRAGDYIKIAMIIRCHRELSLPWENDWKELKTQVTMTPPHGILLARMVIGWNWEKESISLLWDATTRPETESEALDCLWEIYRANNDTPELLRVARQQLNIEPSNPERKNNSAFLSLLVEGASTKTCQLAYQAYQANPKDPGRAATYAYSLHLTGEDQEAEKVMRNLPPEAVRFPGIAFYQALIFDSVGKATEARETLMRLNSQGMLAEERKMALDLARKLKILDEH